MVAAYLSEAVWEPGWSIPLGTPVFDVAGEKLGCVRGADNDALTVEEGLLIITTYTIPMGLVGRFEDGALHLSVTKSEASGNGERA